MSGSKIEKPDSPQIEEISPGDEIENQDSSQIGDSIHVAVLETVHPISLSGGMAARSIVAGRGDVKSIEVLPSGIALVRFGGNRKPRAIRDWNWADLVAHNGGAVTNKGGRPRKGA